MDKVEAELVAGESIGIGINLTVTGGFSETIQLQLTGDAEGLMLSPTEITATESEVNLTITADVAAESRERSLRLLATTAGGLEKSLSITLDVLPAAAEPTPEPGFAVSVATTELTVAFNAPAAQTGVTITPANGFSGAVNVELIGEAAAGLVVKPPTISIDGPDAVDQTLLIVATEDVLHGPRELQLSFSAAGITRLVDLKVQVVPAPPRPTISVAWDLTDLVIFAGESLSIPVVIQPLDGYTGTVVASLEGDYANGLFISGEVQIPDSNPVNSSFTLTADAEAVLGPRDLEIVLDLGLDYNIVRNMTLTVNEPGEPGMTVRLAEPSVSIRPGESTAITAYATPVHGFVGEVQVTLEEVPPGITFGPHEALTLDGPGEQSMQLTFTAAADAAPDGHDLLLNFAAGDVTVLVDLKLNVLPPLDPRFEVQAVPVPEVMTGMPTDIKLTVTPVDGFRGEVQLAVLLTTADLATMTELSDYIHTFESDKPLDVSLTLFPFDETPGSTIEYEFEVWSWSEGLYESVPLSSVVVQGPLLDLTLHPTELSLFPGLEAEYFSVDVGNMRPEAEMYSLTPLDSGDVGTVAFIWGGAIHDFDPLPSDAFLEFSVSAPAEMVSPDQHQVKLLLALADGDGAPLQWDSIELTIDVQDIPIPGIEIVVEEPSVLMAPGESRVFNASIMSVAGFSGTVFSAGYVSGPYTMFLPDSLTLTENQELNFQFTLTLNGNVAPGAIFNPWFQYSDFTDVYDSGEFTIEVSELTDAGVAIEIGGTPALVRGGQLELPISIHIDSDYSGSLLAEFETIGSFDLPDQDDVTLQPGETVETVLRVVGYTELHGETTLFLALRTLDGTIVATSSVELHVLSDWGVDVQGPPAVELPIGGETEVAISFNSGALSGDVSFRLMNAWTVSIVDSDTPLYVDENENVEMVLSLRADTYPMPLAFTDAEILVYGRTGDYRGVWGSLPLTITTTEPLTELQLEVAPDPIVITPGIPFEATLYIDVPTDFSEVANLTMMSSFVTLQPVHAITLQAGTRQEVPLTLEVPRQAVAASHNITFNLSSAETGLLGSVESQVIIESIGRPEVSSDAMLSAWAGGQATVPVTFSSTGGFTGTLSGAIVSNAMDVYGWIDEFILDANESVTLNVNTTVPDSTGLIDDLEFMLYVDGELWNYLPITAVIDVALAPQVDLTFDPETLRLPRGAARNVQLTIDAPEHHAYGPGELIIDWFDGLNYRHDELTVVAGDSKEVTIWVGAESGTPTGEYRQNVQLISSETGEIWATTSYVIDITSHDVPVQWEPARPVLGIGGETEVAITLEASELGGDIELFLRSSTGETVWVDYGQLIPNQPFTFVAPLRIPFDAEPGTIEFEASVTSMEEHGLISEFVFAADVALLPPSFTLTRSSLEMPFGGMREVNVEFPADVLRAHSTVVLEYHSEHASAYHSYKFSLSPVPSVPLAIYAPPKAFGQETIENPGYVTVHHTAADGQSEYLGYQELNLTIQPPVWDLDVAAVGGPLIVVAGDTVPLQLEIEVPPGFSGQAQVLFDIRNSGQGVRLENWSHGFTLSQDVTETMQTVTLLAPDWSVIGTHEYEIAVRSDGIGTWATGVVEIEVIE